MELQHDLVENDAAIEQTRTPRKLLIPELDGLRGLVSNRGLELVLEQIRYIKGKRFRESCRGDFRKKFGLPCAHELYSRMQNTGVLKVNLEDIHERWRYGRDLGQRPPLLH